MLMITSTASDCTGHWADDKGGFKAGGLLKSILKAQYLKKRYCVTR